MRRLLFVIFLHVVIAPAFPVRAAEPGEELTVYVLTMEPGDLVFEKFGHNAIWIHDAYAHPPYDDIVYHWGIFDFDQERFLINYALGQLNYSMGAFPLGEQIEWYEANNRKTLAQELNLTPAEKIKLRDFLRWNVQPENAVYRYNYYTDNCSTRVRDAIDEAIGGRIEAQLRPKRTGTTYRWHTRRLTRDNLFWYWVLHTVLGPATDVPINAWQECFLPLKLRDHLRSVTTTDTAGATVPLVKSEKLLSSSTRSPEPQAPPDWLAPFFLAGVAVGGVFIALNRWAGSKRGGKVAFCVAATLYTALLGFCGLIGLWLWFFSEHWAAWRNENLFAYPPLALPLAFLTPVLFRKSPRIKQIATWLALATAGTTVIGMLLSPVLPQSNAEPMALVLPINLALAWCVWRFSRETSKPAARASAAEV